jgi:hypothetical protein
MKGGSAQASVRVAHAGIRSRRDKDAAGGNGLTLALDDPSGTRETLSWSAAALSQTDSFRRLQDCLQASQQKMRFTEIRLTSTEIDATANSMRRTVLECIRSAGVPPYEETVLPDATEYFVSLRAYWPPTSQQGVVPPSDTSLEGRCRIQRNTTNVTLVHTDVRECLMAATAEVTWGTSASSSDGFGMSSRPANIQPLLDRFERCVRARSYTVEDADQPTTN